MGEGLSISKPEGHLTKGIKPIIACVGSFKDFDYQERNKILSHFNPNSRGVFNVDFRFSAEDVISPPEQDHSNKFSEEFCDCTGLIVVGTEKGTDDNVSFLTHQDPKEFLFSKKEEFTKRLRERLAQIKDKCVPGTIDAVLVGGWYSKDPFTLYFAKKLGLKDRDVAKQYTDSIKLLGAETKEILGFEPIVINGPKTELGLGDKVYFDNKNRRLYFVRPEVNHKTGDFPPSDIGNQKDKWR